MNEITKCLNHICEFIRNKRNVIVNGDSRSICYNELTKNVFGAFKGNRSHKDIYNSIVTTMNGSNSFLNKSVELENLIYVLVELFCKANLDNIMDVSYLILNDLINGVKIGGKSLDDDNDAMLAL